ncbi:T-cell ecto-ADP-ribosyltransferase 2 [Channa argus]|uniref:NAD(P)(+)--arginine ADP-ribosyltransferase n=1 Tax=Channa argus TaxID=215402 RepID=A0A6G1PBV8_CHAAH|nr:T-cell ecto-ADP-ribosyltransferase 2 [Channa argus]KAK2918906.1 hypothetical protein Q8A73_003277 [Channa argus]
MWDKKELLLAAIIFTAGYYRVTGESTTLDMAKDAVDDRYDGCRKEAMEKFIYSGLLREEMKRNEDFEDAWEKITKCSKQIPGGVKEHSTVLSALGDEESHFINEFKKSVRKSGGNVSTYEKEFHFKSFHFLLMDSLMLLSSNNCTTVYYVTNEAYTAEKGSKVRFGTFITSCLSKKSCLMNDLEGMFLFKIYSCYFVNLEENSCSKDTALLSPIEVFTVEDIRTKTDEINDSVYTEIVLKHSGLDSNHNCYLFSRSPANVSTKWRVSLCGALSLFFFIFSS